MEVEHIATHGGDLLVVNAARVSYDRWSDELSDRDIALLRRLARSGHTSPFYHPVTTIRITAPIYVARQLHRHQVGLAMNEVSRRYTDRGVAVVMPDFGKGETQQGIYASSANYALDMYRRLLSDGVPRERARAVLPLGLLTTWIWTGSLYAYANLCRQRLAEDAQSETRAVAQEIAEIMEQQYPVCWPALLENNPPGGQS